MGVTGGVCVCVLMCNQSIIISNIFDYLNIYYSVKSNYNTEPVGITTLSSPIYTSRDILTIGQAVHMDRSLLRPSTKISSRFPFQVIIVAQKNSTSSKKKIIQNNINIDIAYSLSYSFVDFRHIFDRNSTTNTVLSLNVSRFSNNT